MKSFPPKMGEKCKIISELKKLCAWCCLILIFLGVMQNYPRKNISKIQDKVFEYFGEKLISLFSLDGLETEKSTFFWNTQKPYSGFLVCLSLGNSATLPKKLGSGNTRHMDFWVYDSISPAVQAHTLKIGNITGHSMFFNIW